MGRRENYIVQIERCSGQELARWATGLGESYHPDRICFKSQKDLPGVVQLAREKIESLRQAVKPDYLIPLLLIRNNYFYGSSVIHDFLGDPVQFTDKMSALIGENQLLKEENRFN